MNTRRPSNSRLVADRSRTRPDAARTPCGRRPDPRRRRRARRHRRPLDTHAAAETTITVQAEAYAAQSGAQTETTGDTGGGKTSAGSPTATGCGTTTSTSAPPGAHRRARIASAARRRHVELRAGSATGPLLASFAVADRRLADVDDDDREPGDAPTGAQTVFPVLNSAAGGRLRNINWFSVTARRRRTDPVPPRRRRATGSAWPTGATPAQQAADTTAFFALTPKPSPATRCRSPSSTRPARSATTATTTRSSSRACPARRTSTPSSATRAPTRTPPPSRCSRPTATTCNPAEDHSAYWMPTLLPERQGRRPRRQVTVYYGSRLKDPSKTQPFPLGLRMIAGDAKLQATPRTSRATSSGAPASAARSAAPPTAIFPVCAPTAHIVLPAHLPRLLGRQAPGQPRPQGARGRRHRARRLPGAATRCRSRRCRSSSYYAASADTTGITLASGIGVLDARRLLQRLGARRAGRPGAQLPRPGREVQRGRRLLTRRDPGRPSPAPDRARVFPARQVARDVARQASRAIRHIRLLLSHAVRHLGARLRTLSRMKCTGLTRS